jgi:hypothetical protein
MRTPVEQLALFTIGSLADDGGWAFVFDLATLAERLRVPNDEIELALRSVVAIGAVTLRVRDRGCSLQLTLDRDFDFRPKGEAVV